MCGQVITKYYIENVRVRDIAIVPRTDFLLVVGRVSFSHKDLSDKSMAEKQLLCKQNHPLRNYSELNSPLSV